MRIKTIVSQIRRDFTAIYECEHCGATMQGSGYDDSYFHTAVVPKKVCTVCGKQAAVNYRPLTTKYSDNAIV